MVGTWWVQDGRSGRWTGALTGYYRMVGLVGEQVHQSVSSSFLLGLRPCWSHTLPVLQVYAPLASQGARNDRWSCWSNGICDGINSWCLTCSLEKSTFWLLYSCLVFDFKLCRGFWNRWLHTANAIIAMWSLTFSRLQPMIPWGNGHVPDYNTARIEVRTG